MRIPRLYLDTTFLPGTTLALPDTRGHYLTRVLRRDVGDTVVLFDGRGTRISATVSAINRRAPVQLLLADSTANTEPDNAPVTLGIALLKGDGLDEVLQKTTELGVDAVQLLITEHSEYRLPDDPDRMTRRFEHWRAVQMSACEQCGRDWLPTLHGPLRLDDWLSQSHAPAARWLLEPEAQVSIGALRSAAAAALVMAVGPEGGWSTLERQAAIAAGFVEVRLGTPVLRAETAPLAALAMVTVLRQLG